MAGRGRGESKLTLDDFYEAFGSLLRLPKVQRVDRLNWLVANVHRFDSKILKAHYGLLLNLLKRTSPVKPMAQILIEITDESMITQSRVNLICEIYLLKKNSPSVGRLLKSISKICPSHIYLPPVGQKTVGDVRIPLNTALAFAQRFDSCSPETKLVHSVRANTAIYYNLRKRFSDADLAREISTLIPLVEQSGRMPTGLETAIYEYLETTWKEHYSSDFTMVLYLIVAKLFRFWPERSHDILRLRLLGPLKSARGRAIEIILPHLWHLGPVAEELVPDFVEQLLNSRARPMIREKSYLHFYLYYARHDTLVPPASIVTDLIVKQDVYLFLCAQWAHLVPAICTTLQGTFSMLRYSDRAMLIIMKLIGEGAEKLLSGIYNINNSPWLGSYPRLIYTRARAMNIVKSQRLSSAPELIDPAVLMRDAGLPYPEFFQQLVAALESRGLSIVPYLLPENAL